MYFHIDPGHFQQLFQIARRQPFDVSAIDSDQMLSVGAETTDVEVRRQRVDVQRFHVKVFGKWHEQCGGFLADGALVTMRKKKKMKFQVEMI